MSPTNTSTLAENNRYPGAIARTTYRQSSGEEQRKSHTRLRTSNTPVYNVRPVNRRAPNDEGTKNHPHPRHTRAAGKSNSQLH